MSINFFLTDSVDRVDLYPTQIYISRPIENKFRHATLTGRDVYYSYNPAVNTPNNLPEDYGDYRRIQYNLVYVPYSDGLKINEWWRDQKQLNSSQPYLYGDTFTKTMLINANQPLGTMTKPYWGNWSGVVEISTVEAQDV